MRARLWTPVEIEKLKREYADADMQTLALALDHPIASVRDKAYDLGLRRTKQTRFEKGNMSGAAQHNYVPIGTERISKDGYVERKVTDDHPVPTRRWVAVHRIVWEAAHGPIPPGHAVCFRPGRRTADVLLITADALELVSRAELARRNHPVTRDPELAKLVQLKGAITRQMNRIAREAKEKQS